MVMLRSILLTLPLLAAGDFSFPQRPTAPKLVLMRDHRLVRSIGNDYVVDDFIALVQQHGYPAEEHNVTTEDGYRIRFYRIPGSPSNPKKEGKPVVFLQHGLLASSDVWVLLGPNKDLAFLLVDAGYDVWIGNVRGNTYGRSHVRLSPNTDPEFWQYSYHEIGFYDVPAMIDYILESTGEKTLVYIGHSQGTTASYVMMSMRPEYNSKFRLVICLSPVSFWTHRLQQSGNLVLKYARTLKKITEDNRFLELFPQSSLNVLVGKRFCTDESLFQAICIATFFQLFGVSVHQLNTTLLYPLLQHNPAGTSTQSLLHYRQNIIKGTFKAYDYGRITKNIEMYNNSRAPTYNMKNIVAPVALFYARGDYISAEKEALKLSKYLPNLVTMEAVPDESFNHIDFLLGKDAKRLLFDRVINLIDQFKRDENTIVKRFSKSKPNL